jgi:hypothetical protein
MAEDPLEKAHNQTGERNQAKIREYNTHKRIYDSLSEASGSPLKLKEIIGAKTVAEVYRTLDKLTIRREFHDALTKAGITFEFLIEGIKREAIGGDKSMDRLKAYEMLLKTLGLDKYDDASTGVTSSWEERLLKAIEGHEGALEENVTPSHTKLTNYAVVVPQTPSAMKAKKKEAEEMEGSMLFDGYPKRIQLKKW